ncbi:unnamed protein product, partial [Cylicostephanus goldi]
SDRGDRRGGRGRGRGGHGGKDRPALIESAGIFSEGLSGADPGHRKIKDEPDVSITRVKEEVKSGTMPGEGYQISYEEIWESDEEADMQELSELFREGFISDLKHGTVLPHVLPLELQPQFVDLMHKDVQQGLLDEEDEVKAEIELDIKDHILPYVVCLEFTKKVEKVTNISFVAHHSSQSFPYQYLSFVHCELMRRKNFTHTTFESGGGILFVFGRYK